MAFYTCPVTVYRTDNGQQKIMEVSSTELVPGDLVEVP